jgi:hypothetical protein
MKEFVGMVRSEVITRMAVKAVVFWRVFCAVRTEFFRYIFVFKISMYVASVRVLGKFTAHGTSRKAGLAIPSGELKKVARDH